MSFTSDVNDFVVQVAQENEQIVKGTVIQLYSAIIKSSPVDSGRFRSNWFLSHDIPSVRSTKKTDKSGQATTKKMTTDVLNSKSFEVFTLTNNLPYSEVIEFGGYPKVVKQGSLVSKNPSKFEVKSKGGFSKQAPAGVVRVSALRFTALLDLEAKKNNYGGI